MAFQVVEGGLDTAFPQWRKVRQRFDAPREADVAGAVAREMQKLDARIRPGMRVAVGVGSRGVARIDQIAGTVIAELKQRGARPFIVPAMGSHGGATPDGQMDVLAGYGVTPASMGVEFRSGMDTELLGYTPGGFPVHFSREALAADAVLPINRVKVHTDFHGPVESGLSKMLVIGFGKHRGAALIHKQGFDTFHETIPAAAAVVLEKVNVLGGLATVENAYEEPAHIELVPAERISGREPELMNLCRSLMPQIPFDHLDVLVVDYLGKNISGSGMDPNITGRYAVRHIPGDPARNPQKIVVLRLTEQTHGNATGLGAADVTTRAVVENIDYQQFWTNQITSSELGSAATPLWMPDDRQAIAVALITCNRVDVERPRLVRVSSTLHLEEMWVSEALWQSDGVKNPSLEALTDPMPMTFAADGRLADLPLPEHRTGRRPWEED
ncbi:MAG TPA: hypothetical protein VD969_01935 [Symbiobacteriaceae bacterium]|nr:hypothetical protein [Symbiobacteriaceae bacterium]